MPVITARFVAGDDFLSRLIDRGTSDIGYSHVGVLVSGAELAALGWGAGFAIAPGRVYEFGARAAVDRAPSGHAGLQLRPADYAPFTRIAPVEIPVTAAERAEFWRLARVIAGSAYSWRTILGFAIGRNVPEPGTLAFDCSTAFTWLGVNAEIFAPWLHERERQISPNEAWGIATQAAWDRSGRAPVDRASP